MMKLKQADIRNYRSIRDMTVQFDIGCQVLVGINESGKSNLLRALALLAPDSKTSSSDLRIERRDEPPTDDGYVRFVFELTPEEREEAQALMFASVDPQSLDALIVESGNASPLTPKSLIPFRPECIYRVSIRDNSRTFSYWGLPKNWQIRGSWRRVLPSASSITLTRRSDGTSANFSANQVFDASLYEPLSDESALEGLSLKHLEQLYGQALTQVAQTQLPPCIYWRYSEQTILPSQVNSTEFASKPDTCIPLRSMFELAGYSGSQISDAIATAKSGAAHRYTHLLDKVAEAATTHVRHVWRDYKTVGIQLRKNGDLIEPVITDDQVPMDFANRSDGFKRFVSFLLLVSAKVKTSSIVNTLLLVDEPEIALHPSGARNLSRELIDIGRTNSVVYSTHSIFMIDRENVNRHLVVEKKNEVTTYWRADKARIVDEEVLYNAMGFSILEALRKNNVVFEGWRDKQLFGTAARQLVLSEPGLRLDFDQLGRCHAEGVKDIQNVTRLLELTSRGCLVISDCDSAAKQAKRLYTERRGYGTWVDYHDILGPSQFVTGEDFLAQEHVIRKANDFRRGYPSLRELTPADIPATQPKLAQLELWIRSAGLTQDAHSAAMNQLKSVLFEDVDHAAVVPDYEKIVRFVLAFDYGSTIRQ